MIGRLLCLLGYHHPIRANEIAYHESPWLTSYTNAKCLRCEKRSWQNWPPVN
jgi:hypothetical protein